MKQALLFTYLLLLHLGLTAQHVKIEWGDQIKSKHIGRNDTNETPHFLGILNNEFIAYNVDPNRYFLMTFDTVNLNYKNEIMLYNQTSLNMINHEDLKKADLWKGKFFFWIVGYNNHRKTTYLYVRVHNINGDLLSEKMLYEENKLKSFNKNQIFLKYNQDSSGLFLLVKSFDRNSGKANIVIKRFDLNLNETMVKVIQLPWKYKNCTLIGVRFLEDGNLYLDIKYRNPAVPNKFEIVETHPVSKYAFKIYIVGTDSSASVNSYDLNLGENFIPNYTYFLDKDKHLKFLGFYSRKNEFSAEGFFSLEYSPGNKKPEELEMRAFDNRFRSRFMSLKDLEKGTEVSGIGVVDLIQKNDGGVLLLCENRYMFQGTYPTSNHLSYISYAFGDIVIFEIDKNGKWNKYQFVKKGGIARDDAGLTFCYLIIDETFHFFLQEDKRMFESTNDDIQRENFYPGLKKGFNVIVVSTEVDNSPSKQLVYDCEESGIAPYLNFFYKLNGHTMLFLGRDEDFFYRIGKIVIE